MSRDILNEISKRIHSEIDFLSMHSFRSGNLFSCRSQKKKTKKILKEVKNIIFKSLKNCLLQNDINYLF